MLSTDPHADGGSSSKSMRSPYGQPSRDGTTRGGRGPQRRAAEAVCGVRRYSARRRKAMGIDSGPTPSRRGTCSRTGSNAGMGTTIEAVGSTGAWPCPASSADFNGGKEIDALSQKSRQLDLAAESCWFSVPPASCAQADSPWWPTPTSPTSWCVTSKLEAPAATWPSGNVITAGARQAFATPAKTPNSQSSSTRAAHWRSCWRWRNMKV